MRNNTTCPACGHQFNVNYGGANPAILAFFTEETITTLIGSPSKLSIDFLPIDDRIKFIDNSRLDELDVKTLGQSRYTDIIAHLSGIKLDS